MDKYTLQTNVGQSSIGLQIYKFDKEGYEDGSKKNTFRYLVPITSDPPELGGTPDTIEITEADSKVRQYVNDRTDSPQFELSYNFDANGNNYNRIKTHTSPTVADIFLLLLPLGSAFMVKSTVSNWMSGGNPIQGTMALAQQDEAIFIPNLTDQLASFDEGEKVAEWLGITVATQTLADLIDFDSMPSGRETEAVKEALNG